MRGTKVAVAAGLALATIGPARAQGFPDLGYMGTTIGAGGVQTAAMNNVIASSVAPRRAPPRIKAAPRTGTATSYRATPEVAQRVRDQFVGWITRRAGADVGRQVTIAMKGTDPVRDWVKLVEPDGLHAGDIADALAGYWVLNWVVANRSDSDRPQMLAVRDQVHATMASSTAYSRLSEPQRQEFAETLMLNFLLQQAVYVDALKRGDQPALQKLGDAAVARFRSEMGIDLRQITLTRNGFVAKAD
jgi:hypothetical protein